MEVLSESEDNSGYNSDKIDSDLEIELYGALHHSMAPEDQVSTADDFYFIINSTQTQSKSNEGQKRCETNVSSSEPKTNFKDNNKPLNNLFQILDNKIDCSDNEFESNEPNLDNSRNNREIDCIQIDDSSDDSVVVIDDYNYDNKRNNRHKTVIKSKSPKNKSRNKEIDISFGNVSNLSKTSVSAMDQFYNEDSHDSEEEIRNYNAMDSDKRFWKISYNDILLSSNQSNRYYRNRIICRNCDERGHLERQCTQPKKSPVCYLCGLCGHRSERCKSILCSFCLSSKHRSFNCNNLENELVCDECGVRGHEPNQCTYNWRKYHLTTTSTDEEPVISNVTPNPRKCCYNCGAIGKHFGFECPSRPMSSHLPPVSQLMFNPRKSHCFNGRERNNRRNYGEKALYNEFVKSRSSNELSRLSASFNKPLESSAKSSTTSTTVLTINNKNKHMKWIYPETNDTHSYRSDATLGNCRQNIVIGEPIEERTLNDWSSTQPVLGADRRNSAHTLTMTEAHRQINNSMHEESQTHTTPQRYERSKRRKIRRRENNRNKKIGKNEHKLFSETNSQNNSNINFSRTSNSKQNRRSRKHKSRSSEQFI